LEETKHISGEIAEKSHGGFIAYEEISTADVKTVEGQTIKKFQVSLFDNNQNYRIIYFIGILSI
jgi:hypothetical protein